MTKIVVLPSDQSGCGYYRLIYPAQALQDQGADVEIRNLAGGPRMLWDTNWEGLAEPPPSAHVVGVGSFDADILVIQRPTRRVWYETIPLLQASGVKVVVDIDDRLDSLHHRHMGRHQFQAKTSPTSNSSWTDLICQVADLVTCSTPALVERYGYGHGVVLPNYVPQAYLEMPRKPSRCLGWSGTLQTHPGDLETTYGGVGAALRGQEDWRLHVIGTGEGVAQALEAPEPTATGWLPFGLYPAALSQLEIGIVPLADSLFNQAKSCLKMAEMAALGVAVIASPTPDNRRMFDAGVGLLAGSRGTWTRRLRLLMNNDQVRQGVAQASRSAMAGFTYEKNAERWWGAWTTLVTHRGVRELV